MSTPCNKCNEVTTTNHICAPKSCDNLTLCDCPTKLGTNCVTYTGDDLPCTKIKKNTIITDAWKQLDTFICKAISDLNKTFNLINIGVITNAKIYKGINLLGEKEIRSITKTGSLITVTENPNDISFGIDTTALTTFVETVDKTSSISNSGTIGAKVYNETPTVLGNNTDYKIRRIKTNNSGLQGESILKTEIENTNDITISAKKINSNTLNIIPSLDGNTLNINVPDTFQGQGYYVNGNYFGEELGTQSKPFITVQKCIDKILNRGSQNVAGTPVKNKWDNLPATKVYIQSIQTFNENLAINNVIWYLDGFDKNASLVTTNNLEYCFDMQELVTNVPKLANGQLPYYLNCYLEGQGYLQNNSPNRKGYVQAIGFSDGITFHQAESRFYLGAKGSNIFMTMIQKLSLGYVPLTSRAGLPIIRENIEMKGLPDTTVLQYGALTIKGRNLPYGESLFLAGNLLIGYYEQHMMFFDNGVAYSDNVEIFYQRNYQNVNFSNVRLFNINTGYSSLDLVNGTDLKDKNGNSVTDPIFLNDINTVKKYFPSTKISDIYLKNNSSLTMSGNFYTQINTAANEGGSEAFVTIVRNSAVNLQGLKITNLLFNHFVKLVNSPNQNPINNPSDSQNFSNCQINEGDFNSQCYEELISCEEQDLNDNIIVNNTRAYYNITFKNSTLNNINHNIFRKLSNLILNSRLFIVGNPIKIFNTFLYPQIPNYDTNALALVDLPIGSQYKTSTGELRIVV